MKKFAITDNKGFCMTFENGLTASVHWGIGNYCENRLTKPPFAIYEDTESNNASVAVYDKYGSMLYVDRFLPDGCENDGEVAGWLSPEQIVEFLANVKNYKED